MQKRFNKVKIIDILYFSIDVTIRVSLKTFYFIPIFICAFSYKPNTAVINSLINIQLLYTNYNNYNNYYSNNCYFIFAYNYYC